MNPEDNIKNFFQKRLVDNTSLTEDWNTPSEDIWEKAKVHFPKEEESRKPFLFICLGLAALILVGFIGYTLLGNIQDQQIADNNLLEETDENLTVNNAETDSYLIRASSANNANTSPVKSQIEKNINNTNNNKIDPIKQNKSKAINSTNRINKSNEIAAKPIDNNLNKTNIELSHQFIGDEGMETSHSTSNSNPTLSTSLSSTLSTSTSANSTLVENNANNTIDIIKLSELQGAPIDLLKYDITDSLNMNFVITPLKEYKKWEVGVSTSPLAIPIVKLINADSLDSEITNIKLKYIGLNLPVTRILNEKWSITSGLYYKRGNLTAKFEEEETLDIGDNISLMLDEMTGTTNISLEDKTQEIELRLKPDEQIIDGDVLLANGSGKFEFNVFQIPLLANYHIRKNKFEYIFSFGTSADLAYVKISEFDIALSKENRIITQPITFNPLSHYYLEYSMYAGVGAKYHFNESTNLSYTLKSDLTAIILTTHDIGLHYRF